MAEPNSAWKMYRAMVGVGMGCALLIVLVYQLTFPIIARAKAEALADAVVKVLPGTELKTALTLRGEQLVTATEGEPEVMYAAFDATKNLIGFAIPAQGMGYQDTISVLYGYAPAKQQVIGFHVLDSRETPGLGDRIAFDEAFLSNFEALDASQPIVAVKTGEKNAAWQIDGISGATVSSVAIAKILSESTQTWGPAIANQLDQLSEAPHEQP